MREEVSTPTITTLEQLQQIPISEIFTAIFGRVPISLGLFCPFGETPQEVVAEAFRLIRDSLIAREEELRMEALWIKEREERERAIDEAWDIRRQMEVEEALKRG